MMNHILLFVTVLILLCSCGCNRRNNITNNSLSDTLDVSHCNKLTVFINYMQKVDGYTVKVKCVVDTVNGVNTAIGYYQSKSDYAIRGESVLHFTSETDSFEIKVPDFTDHGLYNNTLPLSDSMTVEAEYTPYKPTANNENFLFLTNSPFFFFDIDFDGEEELFINSYDTFLKGHSEFTIYKRSANRILTEAPYNAITDYTRIDIENMRLHIPHENCGEMCTAPGYVSYRIEREVKYDDNSHNIVFKNVYKPYRLEAWQKDNIYKVYETDGKTISFKGTINKAE